MGTGDIEPSGQGNVGTIGSGGTGPLIHDVHDMVMPGVMERPQIRDREAPYPVHSPIAPPIEPDKPPTIH